MSGISELRQSRQDALRIVEKSSTTRTASQVGDAPMVSIEGRVRSILKARRARESLFGAELFADPAWDMLLELYSAELAQRRQTVSGLCAGAAVPATTALRWINHLEVRGLVCKNPDVLDRRRVFVSLSENAKGMMKEYFEALSDDVPAV